MISVPTNRLAEAWSIVGDMVMSAVDVGGDEEEDHVLSSIMEGIYQLWIVSLDDKPVAGIVTQVAIRPSRKVLICRYLGGEHLFEWVHAVMPDMEEFARWAGCDFMEFDTRPELAAVAHRVGFKPVRTTFRLEVPCGQQQSRH